MASAHYTDLPHLLRRREDMDLAAEMQWSLLPPLAFTSAGTTLAGLLEPAYEVGGDCFDYAVNGGILDLAIFDAMGHGLASAILASLLVGAYRHGRRAGHDLPEIADRHRHRCPRVPGAATFATALLARLNLDTGQLSWLSCGHPPPIIVRRGNTLPPADARARAAARARGARPRRRHADRRRPRTRRRRPALHRRRHRSPRPRR